MSRIVFRNARLLDGERPPRAGIGLVVEPPVIARVGPDETVELRDGDRVVDLRGRTLMPGLWSSHFHTTFSGGSPMQAPVLGLEAQPSVMVLAAAHNVKTALDHGFTSLICSSTPYNIDAGLKQAIHRGLIEGPRIFACTRELMTPGDQPDGVNHNWYMELGNHGLVRLCSGPEEFRHAVREEMGRGADIAKVCASPGHGAGPADETESIAPEELRAAADAAHGRGKHIRAHAASKRSILECARAGVDIIDHADRIDAECIDAILAADVAVTPSMLFSERFMGFLEAMLSGDKAWPPSIVEPPDKVQARIAGGRADFENISRVLPDANRAGVRLLVGDDFGVIGLPHGDYVDELLLYVKLGIPELDVLRWATRNGAQTMGLGDELGTLEEGKRADLLVVDGDPSSDIGCLKDPARIQAILIDGVPRKDTLPS